MCDMDPIYLPTIIVHASRNKYELSKEFRNFALSYDLVPSPVAVCDIWLFGLIVDPNHNKTREQTYS